MMEETIVVPAEKWNPIAATNNCGRVVEQKGDKPVSVRAVRHAGNVYAIFGAAHGGYGKEFKSSADGYRLLPEALYVGETTPVYHDEEAIKSGRRERGNLTGLIVVVDRQRMVCASKASFVMDIPTTRPMSQAEAMEFDVQERESGWRSHWYSGKTPEWFSFRGHPVAVYRGHSTLDTNSATLFWKHAGRIHELRIDADVELAAKELATAPAAAGQEPELGQLVLF